MLRTVLRAAVRRSLNDVRHIRPVRPGRARGGVALLYERVERDFGVLAPPVAMLSPAPECAAATWTALRESLLVPGRTGRTDREAVATSVSRDNACPYCVEVHGATLGSLGGGDGGGGLRLLEAAADDPVRHAELGAVALTFQHINRVVNVFLPESPLPASAPRAARPSLIRATGGAIAHRPGPPITPDTALDLLPPRSRHAPAPDDLDWAAGAPHVLRALSAAADTIDGAGERALPASVRELLLRNLDEHGTGPAGIDRSWVQEAVRDLVPRDRPLGRLVLLTARASFQVGDDAVASCREAGADDATLVRAVAWAALTAPSKSLPASAVMALNASASEAAVPARRKTK
ncbi:carboxymuconolactone decarboxylase family protein, partial [Nocardiopsis sp. RV163]|uniref:carboxymuconolactone decarboxylase family protein n=1 Tax=Nocardiopsis sp. RV163 TaxID=1661388 RepID=UPI00069D4DEF